MGAWFSPMLVVYNHLELNHRLPGVQEVWTPLMRLFTLAAHWSKIGSFKRIWCLDPTPRNTEVNGLCFQIFNGFLGDSNVQLRLTTCAINPWLWGLKHYTNHPGSLQSTVGSDSGDMGWGWDSAFLSCTYVLNGLVVFPTFFNLSLNLVIRSSWSEPQSAPGLVFVDCIELLHLWLQRT